MRMGPLVSFPPRPRLADRQCREISDFVRVKGLVIRLPTKMHVLHQDTGTLGEFGLGIELMAIRHLLVFVGAMSTHTAPVHGRTVPRSCPIALCQLIEK